MNFWQRWVKAPQTLAFRKLLFQVHLWAGIALGLYVLVIALTGSAILLKSPFYSWFEPKYVEPVGEPLEGEALRARMEEVYSEYEMGFTVEGFTPDEATFVVLEKDGIHTPYYFNQYTGESIGLARPWMLEGIEWMIDMHDDLFMGRNPGRQINGAAALTFVVMSLTGLLIWWRGRTRWWEGLLIVPGSKRKMMWQLHSFFGFWSLLLMFAWGVSGFQLGFPGMISDFLIALDMDKTDQAIPGERILVFFRDVHFGRIGVDGGPIVAWAWILASFIPTLLVITGFILWWRRVVVRQWQALRATPKAQPVTPLTE